MVNVPVVTTFAMDEPETQPISALLTTAVLAGPPRKRPAIPYAMSIKNLPAPAASSMSPKRTNSMINDALVPSAEP